MTEHTVLFVDDEENILNALKRVLGREKYRVLTAASGQEGLKVLEEHEVQVVVSDQRMPEMSGTEFLTHVMRRYPDVIRVVLSGFSDVGTITDAVNRGHIYKFFPKPWNDDVLKMEIESALAHYDLVHLNKSLHQKIMEQNEELKRYNETLEETIRIKNQELEIQNRFFKLSWEILEHIPMPVIGVSEHGIVVLANGAASRLSFDGRQITAGGDIADYLPENVMEIFHKGLVGNTVSGVRDCTIGEETYDIDMSPLSGKENRSRMILIFRRRAS